MGLSVLFSYFVGPDSGQICALHSRSYWLALPKTSEQPNRIHKAQINQSKNNTHAGEQKIRFWRKIVKINRYLSSQENIFKSTYFHEMENIETKKLSKLLEQVERVKNNADCLTN